MEGPAEPRASFASGESGPEPQGSKWAGGWGRLAVQPAGPGAAVTLRVMLAKAAAGKLLLVGYKAALGSRFDLLWDGQALGTVEAGPLPAPFERRLAYLPIPAVNAGDHELTVKPQGIGPLALDFIQFGDPVVWEAELLPFYARADFAIYPTARPQDPAPDQNVAIRHFTGDLTTPLVLGVPALQAGRHKLALWVVAEGAKQYKFELNGVPLPAPTILPQPNAQTRIELGTVDLKEGLNLLSVGTDGYLRVDAVETAPAG